MSLQDATQKRSVINVLTVPALKEAFSELAPAFEKSTLHPVVVSFSGTDDIMTRVKDGESLADLVILDAGSVAELTRLGKLVPGSCIDFAKSRIGVAVRAGAPRPEIGGVEAIKRALLSASTIAYSRSLSGLHMARLIESWGMTQQLEAKIRLPAPGEFVGEMVARGEADIGFQQISELVHVVGIDLIGPLPPEIQLVTVVSGGMHAAAREPGAAGAWMEFLASAAAVSVLQRNGLDPD